MDARVEAILRQLDKCWNQPLNIPALAQLQGLSPVRLRHIFRSETGQSIQAFVMSRRTQQAAQLLLESDLSIKEIQHYVGFTDASDFHRSFRKRYGMSPSKYRLQSRPL